VLLRGVDLALVPENVLDYADTTASLGPDLPERLTYISRLYGEEVHILVGPGAYSIENLSGKKIAVPPEDGNAEFTVRDLLRRLHIDADVVKVAAADAIDDVRSGALAALVSGRRQAFALCCCDLARRKPPCAGLAGDSSVGRRLFAEQPSRG